MSSTNDGHCVWHSVCHRSKNTGKSVVKNCAYDGPAKSLNSVGVEMLREWCPHMIPENYVEGQEVRTCCDVEQVCAKSIR